uniref:Reverse transcriptase domain-containing protein n=1 Tax=Tanacetum cinerariifolium TaxID=118510 RepID=A0A6L2LID4_TANCI|nr:reverse transcriptase domain-containing protein [Tanacetum cinerariifolium]
MSGSLKPRRDRSKSPREKDPKRRTVFKRLEKDVFHRLGDKEKKVFTHSRGSERKSYYSSRKDTKSCCQSSRSKETEIASEKHHQKREYSRRTKVVSENPFTHRIRYFDFPKARMPSHIKTYDGSEDPKDHMKIFQAAAKTERWAMPTWCYMFNSTLTGNARVWFDDLPKESIDSYDDLRKTFLENYLQQKKCIKDPIEIHNIKQRDGEYTEEFVRRYQLECRDVKGAPKCMKIFKFMHGITNLELIKRLHDKIPKSMDEMMSVTTSFLRGEVAASNRERKKSFSPWKQEAGQKQNFKKGNFWNEQRTKRKQDRFTLLTKTPKEILALDKGKRNAKGRKALIFDQIIKAKPWKRPGKDSKKGGNLKERQTAGNINGATMAKDSKAKNYSNFFPRINNFFPNSRGEDGTEGPMIIEAEMGGHCVHPIYMDGGSSSEILYKHCFSKFHPEIKNQLIPANTPLVGFSGELIWPLGQISLLVKIGNEEHSTSAWINFMVVRSPSPYNEIIGRHVVRNIRAIPSTTNEMIKFSVAGGIVTLQSSKIIPLECSMVSKPGVPRSLENVRGLQGLKQSVPERWLSATGNRLKGTFLRYKVDANGMRVCPDKVEAVLDLLSPKCLKDVQKLNGKLANLNRFMSKSAEKSLPFFKTLKKEKEELIMYLAAAKEAIGAVLMTERDGKQLPIYFISRALQGPEINYTPMEKLILTLVSAIKRLLKWIFELGEHDIQYRPRTSVKGQILADFIVERPKDDTPDTSMKDGEELLETWILFTDRSSCIDGSRAGLIITNPKGMEFTYALRFRFNATNNEAEYEALIAGLRIARQIGVQNLQANVNSKLVANHVN